MVEGFARELHGTCGLLLERDGEFRALFIALGEFESAVVSTHDLTRETETYARTFGLGGEEWYEYLLLTLWSDRRTVIGYVDESLLVAINLGTYTDVSGICLNGIFDKIDEDTADL